MYKLLVSPHFAIVPFQSPYGVITLFVFRMAAVTEVEPKYVRAGFKQRSN